MLGCQFSASLAQSAGIFTLKIIVIFIHLQNRNGIEYPYYLHLFYRWYIFYIKILRKCQPLMTLISWPRAVTISATVISLTGFVRRLNSSSVRCSSSIYQYLVPSVFSVDGPSRRWRFPFLNQALEPLKCSTAGPSRRCSLAFQWF